MSKRTHAMLHCASTPEGKYFDKEDILQWHLKDNEWSRPGYSKIWLLDGTEQELIGDDGDDEVDLWELTYGAKGWNAKCKHFCYIGGVDENGECKDTRTGPQEAKMRETLLKLIRQQPDIKIIGHNQVNRHKFCPSFYVPEWCEIMGIPKENIDYNNYANNPFVRQWQNQA